MSASAPVGPGAFGQLVAEHQQRLSAMSMVMVRNPVVAVLATGLRVDDAETFSTRRASDISREDMDRSGVAISGSSSFTTGFGLRKLPSCAWGSSRTGNQGTARARVPGISLDVWNGLNPWSQGTLSRPAVAHARAAGFARQMPSECPRRRAVTIGRRDSVWPFRDRALVATVDRRLTPSQPHAQTAPVAGQRWVSLRRRLVRYDMLSDMKTVTLRALRRDAALLDSAAEGQEILVTRFGRPYVRIVPARQPNSFLGAGKHLGQKAPVSPDPVPADEWKGLG